MGESSPGAESSLASILRELAKCEVALLGAHGTSPQAVAPDGLAALLDDEFREIGASGRCYSRSDVIGAITDRQAAPAGESWLMNDFECLPLCGDTYLLTYTLSQEGSRTTRRSSIWKRTPGGWKMLFHQGTVVQGA